MATGRNRFRFKRALYFGVTFFLSVACFALLAFNDRSKSEFKVSEATPSEGSVSSISDESNLDQIPLHGWSLNHSLKSVNAIDPSTAEDHQEISLSYHRILREELIKRVVFLSRSSAAEHRGLKSRVSDILDKMVLLNRVDQLHGIRHQRALVRNDEIKADFTEVQNIWQTKHRYATQVDQLLSQYNFLSCEHFPELIEQWNLSPLTP